MDAELLRNWDVFLNGYWTKARPRKSGLYPVAVAGGVKYIKVSQQLLASEPWDGYYWSEPMPSLPSFPLD